MIRTGVVAAAKETLNVKGGAMNGKGSVPTLHIRSKRSTFPAADNTRSHRPPRPHLLCIANTHRELANRIIEQRCVEGYPFIQCRTSNC